MIDNVREREREKNSHKHAEIVKNFDVNVRKKPFQLLF